MRKGDTGAEVRQLQQQLNDVGLKVDKDGWYGDGTEEAVKAFQRRAGLVADGIAGDKTLQLLRSGDRNPKLLTQQAINAAAERLDVAVAAIMAVNEVESLGAGFLADGRPKILFERHVFAQRLDKLGLDVDALAARYSNIVSRQRGGYTGGAGEYSRLAMAQSINGDAALESASWGQYQIMGYHWEPLGYASAGEFVAAMQRSEDEQLDAFIRFIETDANLHKALKAGKWADFAKGYNGPAYKENLYDVKLARAFERHSDDVKAAA